MSDLGPTGPSGRTGSPALSAIVLAGGRSSRFGEDKLAADINGRPILEVTIAAVRDLADEVIVVGRSGGVAGVTYVSDERPFEGPLAGLVTGLGAAAGAIVLAVGGDMPALDPALLRLLVGRVGGPSARRPRRAAVVLEEAGSLRPLPLAARRQPALAAAQAAIAAGDGSLRGLLARLAASTIAEREWRAVDPLGDSLLDVDTPADLARARARLGRRS